MSRQLSFLTFSSKKNASPYPQGWNEGSVLSIAVEKRSSSAVSFDAFSTLSSTFIFHFSLFFEPSPVSLSFATTLYADLLLLLQWVHAQSLCLSSPTLNVD
jgi:hypothetical protein